MADPDEVSLKKDTIYEFKPFRVPKYKIKFEKADRLSVIPGYTWYTPAALYLWGHFSEVNLSDIVRHDDLKIFWYQFEKPIFKHFEISGDRAWNYTLWAARDDQWRKLLDRVLEAVQFDIPNQILYQYAMQSVTVCDPLFADTHSVLPLDFPTVDVYAFAVLSNICQFAFDSKSKDRVPGMVRFKPLPLHVKAASKVFSMPNLNRDKAFTAIKDLLAQEQDEEYDHKRLNK